MVTCCGTGRGVADLARGGRHSIPSLASGVPHGSTGRDSCVSHTICRSNKLRGVSERLREVGLFRVIGGVGVVGMGLVNGGVDCGTNKVGSVNTRAIRSDVLGLGPLRPCGR